MRGCECECQCCTNWDKGEAQVLREMRLKTALALVEQQANDVALWFRTKRAPEAYLQRALRALHAALEGRE